MSAATWHRSWGVIACGAIFLFALSGLMHPVMSRLQPQPVTRDAPAASLPAAALTPTTVLRQHSIEQVAGLRLVRAGTHSAYRVETAGHSRYFVAADGQPLIDGERLHAETLARHASGDHDSAVREMVPVTAFDGDYPEVNRYLPVWRVRFDRADGLTAYVDTRGNRLSTLQDHPKRVAQAIFLQLHNLVALEALPWLRLPLMLLLLTATVITTVSGLRLFFRAGASRRRTHATDATRERRWRLTPRDQHRYLALSIALASAAFAFSGGWHLLHAASQPASPPVPPSRFATSELGDWLPATAFQLVRVNGTPCYRIAGGGASHGHHHHGGQTSTPVALASCHDTATGGALADAEQELATTLARHYAGAAPTVPATLRPIMTFDDDYGFASKRLPVWQVRFGDDPRRWYVETSSGALALRADGASAREGWVFSHLHKWQFIPDRTLRDALLMACAALQLLVAGLGLRLFLRRRRLRGASGQPRPGATAGAALERPVR